MRMAKTPERVSTFLSELKDKLQALKKEEMSLFLEYKKEDVSDQCPRAVFDLAHHFQG